VPNNILVKFLLALLFIAQLLFLAFRSQIAVLRTKASLPADTLQVVATAAAFYASFIEDQRSVQPSDILTLYFSASSVLSVPRLRSLWLISSVIVCRALATIAFVLTVFTLVLECSTKAEFLRPQYRHITKEQAQSIWGRTFFIYTIPFFRAGFSNILSLDNVLDVDQELQGQIAGQKLRDAWVFTKGRHRLVKSTFVAYSCSFFSAVLSRLLLAVFTFAQPFLITATIQFMQHPATDDSKYYGGSLVGAFVLLYAGLAVSPVNKTAILCDTHIETDHYIHLLETNLPFHYRHPIWVDISNI
jgi:ATP-binding cassette subfamily C (CFTR/MRP) protein 1